MLQCHICGATEDLQWCGRCNVYLCPRCRENWPARVAAAVKHWWQAVQRPERLY